MDAAVAGLAGACIGAFAGVAGTIATAFITKRSEERRHIRETVLHTALESWRESLAFGKFKIEHGEKVAVFPLESFIISMRHLARMIERDDLTVQDARQCVREYTAITDAVAEEFRRYDQEQKKKAQQSGAANGSLRSP